MRPPPHGPTPTKASVHQKLSCHRVSSSAGHHTLRGSSYELVYRRQHYISGVILRRPNRRMDLRRTVRGSSLSDQRGPRWNDTVVRGVGLHAVDSLSNNNGSLLETNTQLLSPTSPSQGSIPIAGSNDSTVRT